MSIAYLLVALGLGILALAVWALMWAIDAGQYDDLERQGAMVLEEDGPPAARAEAAGETTRTGAA